MCIFANSFRGEWECANSFPIRITPRRVVLTKPRFRIVSLVHSRSYSENGTNRSHALAHFQGTFMMLKVQHGLRLQSPFSKEYLKLIYLHVSPTTRASISLFFLLFRAIFLPQTWPLKFPAHLRSIVYIIYVKSLRIELLTFCEQYLTHL